MTGQVPPAQQSRLLIVDDDPGTVRLLIHILHGMGSIRFATSGTEAIETARAFRPDIILLDVEMPDVDGFAVCDALKSDPTFTDVPVLFVTAHGEVEVEERALTAGALDFIPKPPNPPVVRARVRNYLALKQRTDQLRLLSTIDGLTGVANRRAFDSALDLEWRRACRAGDPLSLIMFDVDYFKRFNDTYGHQAGDDCLRALASTASAAAKRPGELTARYGGEEFTVLLPACSQEQAAGVAETIRGAVAGLRIPHAASEAGDVVTVSLGVASIATTCETTHGPLLHSGVCLFKNACRLGCEDLVKAADSALYQAKRAGRNRVGSIMSNRTAQEQALLLSCAMSPD